MSQRPISKLDASMKLLTISVAWWALANPVCADDKTLDFQRLMECKKCPEHFDPGPRTNEKDLFTTQTPYKISREKVVLTIHGKAVFGHFDFPSYRVFADDENHPYCQETRSISGDFKGMLKGHAALVSYQHSWNESGGPDTAQIVLAPNEMKWTSLGEQHGYLGMMPKFMVLSRTSTRGKEAVMDFQR